MTSLAVPMRVNAILVVLSIITSADVLLGEAQDIPPTQFVNEPRSGSPEVTGNTKLLVCAANGQPTPFYRWTKDDATWNPSGSGRRAQGSSRQVVEDGSSGTLRIRNVSISDAGRYRCSAHNSLGALRSRVAVVQVAYISPLASSNVIEKHVNAGDSVLLNLPRIECNPAPSVQWFEGSSRTALRLGVVENYHVSLANQLVVLGARIGVDNKIWRAMATNAFTQQTISGPTYILRVNSSTDIGNVAEVAPLSVVIGPTDTRVVEDVDEAVKFECVVNASPLTYASQRWYRITDTGQTMSLGNDNNKYLFSSYRRVVTILRPTVADAGLYRCESTYHRPSTPPNQDVKISAEAQLTVFVRPSFSVTPNAVVDHMVETRLVVPCSAVGKPRPTISWYRNAVLINNSSRIHVAENGSLIIPLALEDDSAVYQCFASSEAGETYAVMRLRIFGIAPYFVRIPQNHTVIVGSTVRLECQANGAPSPAISWTRVKSTPGSIVEAIGSGSELTLTSVAISDSGVYSCTAINSKGAANGYAYVRVTVKTRIVNRLPSSTLAIVGSTVTLPCGVDSDAYHSVIWSWYHNSSLVTESRAPGNVKIEQDGGLRLSSVTKADVGTFTCDVESTGGEDSSSGWLNVIDRPLSPFVISVSLGSELRSVEVIWMADFEDNMFVNKFIIYAQSFSTGSVMGINNSVAVGELLVDKMASSYSLVVRNLRPSFIYSFSVSAVNDAGEGLPSSSSMQVVIPEEIPEGPPREFMASQNSTTSITVCWLPPEEINWNGKLLGYVVRYVEQFQSNIKSLSINFTDSSRRCAQIDDLEVGVVYELSISCFNSAGVGPFSESIQAMIAEGVPVQPASNITVIAVSATRIEVTFLPPPHASRQSTLGYRLYARRIPANSSESEDMRNTISTIRKRSVAENDGLVVVAGSLVGKSIEKVQVGGLRKFTTYEICVLCFTAAGQGPPSSPVVVQTMEDVPEEVVALTAELLPNSTVVFQWSRPLQTNGLLMGYKLYFTIDSDTHAERMLPANAKRFALSVPVASLCTLRVAAFTKMGEGPTKSISLTAGRTTVTPSSTTVQASSLQSSAILSTSLKTTTTSAIISTTLSISPSTSQHSSPRSSATLPNDDQLVSYVSISSTPASTVSHLNLSYVSSIVVSADDPVMDPLMPKGGAKTSADDDAIYQHWWFVLIMALTGVVLIVSLVVLICWTERRHRRRVKRLEGNGLASALEAKAEFQLAPQVDENEGFTTIGRRQRWNQSKLPQNGTVPRYTRAPPRPSPGSILYDDVDVGLHQAMTSFRDDDSGHASDRACQDIEDDESDVYTRLQTSSLHRQRYLNFPDASVRPRSHYDSTCLAPSVHNTSGVYQTITFSGDDQSMTPAQSSTFRPPVFSSFT